MLHYLSFTVPGEVTVTMWCVFFVKLLTLITGTKAVQVLVVSNKGVNLYNTTSGHRTGLMMENEQMMKEVDYHYGRREIFALTKRQIIRCPLTVTSSYEYRPVVYSEDEYSFMSMTVDWVHDTLYWTAGPVFMIHKSAIDGSNHSVIFRGYYIETYHKKMLVDPHARLLIWAMASQIYSTDLNGKNTKKITFPEVLGSVRSRVKNIAVDVTRSRLYFLAGFEDDDVWLMMSGNYDGSGFRRHDPVSRFTYAIAAMGDDLYWVAKEKMETTYSPRGFKKLHTLALYRASVQAPGTSQRLLDLNTGAVWNMKICDPEFQRSSGNVSSQST
uniref:Olfactomedin-like domain-containing protein n=1 Tax=Graphocephala atropunctata TaxID=36148 RepID=A0A1B6MJ29_9HEMI